MKTLPRSIPGYWFGLLLLTATVCIGLAQTDSGPARADTLADPGLDRADDSAPPPSAPAPPPSAPAPLSAAELEKLVAPIALYPDALIATILPASVYPLEIVQAARFVADTNNLAKLDEQPWDDNVKAIARVPEAIKKLNDDLQWTMQLGEVFLAQDKDVMDAIQRLRLKSQEKGMLKTSEQMIVVVTNTVTETRVEQQVVVVTNTVVQIQSANPEVIYVPQYNPVYVYAPPPTYVYDPYVPFFTFAAGVAVGAIIANNCDWHHGGCYHGGDVDVDINRNVNRNVNRNTDRASARQNSGQGQKWKPDQSRLNKSGSAGASARSQEARGWGGAPGHPPEQPATDRQRERLVRVHPPGQSATVRQREQVPQVTGLPPEMLPRDLPPVRPRPTGLLLLPLPVAQHNRPAFRKIGPVLPDPALPHPAAPLAARAVVLEPVIIATAVPLVAVVAVAVAVADVVVVGEAAAADVAAAVADVELLIINSNSENFFYEILQ